MFQITPVDGANLKESILVIRSWGYASIATKKIRKVPFKNR